MNWRRWTPVDRAPFGGSSAGQRVHLKVSSVYGDSRSAMRLNLAQGPSPPNSALSCWSLHLRGNPAEAAALRLGSVRRVTRKRRRTPRREAEARVSCGSSYSTAANTREFRPWPSARAAILNASLECTFHSAQGTSAAINFQFAAAVAALDLATRYRLAPSLALTQFKNRGSTSRVGQELPSLGGWLAAELDGCLAAAAEATRVLRGCQSPVRVCHGVGQPIRLACLQLAQERAGSRRELEWPFENRGGGSAATQPGISQRGRVGTEISRTGADRDKCRAFPT
jgi:hypothetical protein